MPIVSDPDVFSFNQIEQIPRGSSLVRFSFDHLAGQKDLAHAVFTRLGGISPVPFDSLNVSFRTPDNPANVARNLETVQKTVGAEKVFTLDQVHGDDILCLRADAREPHGESPRADGVITDTPGIGLLIKQADCQGVLLYDPQKHVLGNIHCGWRGNVSGILGKAVKGMSRHFDCRPGDIIAGIGPSLGPCCGEFRGYSGIFPDSFKAFMVRENYFDLWSLSTTQLIRAGLRKENIQVAKICTRCRTDLFFSYRGEGTTGRFGTVAVLL